MVNNRGSSLMRTASISKFLTRKQSPRTFVLYIVFLFAFSIFIFVFNAGNIVEDQQKPNFSHESHSQSQPQTQFLQVWDSVFLRFLLMDIIFETFEKWVNVFLHYLKLYKEIGWHLGISLIIKCMIYV